MPLARYRLWHAIFHVGQNQPVQNGISSWDGRKAATTWISLTLPEMLEEQAHEALPRSHPTAAAPSTGLLARKNINSAQIIRDEMRPIGSFNSL